MSSKVTELEKVGTLKTSGATYLSQDGADWQLTIEDLLGKLPNTPAKFKGVLALGGTKQTLNNSGTVSTTQSTTLLSNSVSSTINIAAGTHDGQLKKILFTSGSSTTTLTAGTATVLFSLPGHTCVLTWENDTWWVIGGTAPVQY